MTTPKATLVATLTEAPSEDGREIAGLPADVLEVRADLVGELGVSWLRERFAGKLLYTLRSTAEGGSFSGGVEQRARRLWQALEAGYDLIDLEAERDVPMELLDEVPRGRRLLSWHGRSKSLGALAERFERMHEVGGAYYKLVPEARQSGQELVPLQLLERLGRRDVIAFASGAVGTWSRLLAPRLGAPWVYAAAGQVPAAPGQLGLQQLIADYGLPELRPLEALLGIVGRPVAHSLSPRIHNAAYRALGLPALYLPFHAESFGDFWLEVVESEGLRQLGYSIRGLSVTAPFKDVALAVAGAASPLADYIGAANTLVQHAEVWEAESTDPAGVIEPLTRHGVTIKAAAAAVVGSGGAGRSAAVGLVQAGARVTLVNRSIERGEEAAEALRLPFLPLDHFDPEPFSVVVHATSLGRGDDELPFRPDRLRPGAAVVDLVYREEPTPLIEACRARGLLAVDGREVLLHQARGQFRMMTGREMPLEIAREALGIEGG